jgi:hypothetical protein
LDTQLLSVLVDKMLGIAIMLLPLEITLLLLVQDLQHFLHQVEELVVGKALRQQVLEVLVVVVKVPTQLDNLVVLETLEDLLQ